MLEVKLINPNDEFSHGFPIPFENACNLTESLELRYRGCKRLSLLILQCWKMRKRFIKAR